MIKFIFKIVCISVSLFYTTQISAFLKLRLRKTDYTAKSFKYEGTLPIVIDESLLSNAKILQNNVNPMIGYLGIPIELRMSKEHAKGKYIGQLDNLKAKDPTSFIHASIPAK
jgi:hypothetical protein